MRDLWLHGQAPLELLSVEGDLARRPHGGGPLVPREPSPLLAAAIGWGSGSMDGDLSRRRRTRPSLELLGVGGSRTRSIDVFRKTTARRS